MNFELFDYSEENGTSVYCKERHIKIDHWICIHKGIQIHNKIF